MLTSDDITTRETIELAPLTLEWGSWPVPATVSIAWGARAIYRLTSNDTKYNRAGKVTRRASTIATIDLLYDRQGIATRIDPPTPIVLSQIKAFTKWIERVAMPELRRECVARYITADSNAEIEIERDGYKLVAGPRASHGYLYIRAWKVA